MAMADVVSRLIGPDAPGPRSRAMAGSPVMTTSRRSGAVTTNGTPAGVAMTGFICARYWSIAATGRHHQQGPRQRRSAHAPMPRM